MADMQKTPFVRDLASSDRKIRDKAVDSLTLFLRSKTDVSLVDLLKLWKGLFFCFYHSDRPLTQQALARSLSYSLVPILPRSTLHRFLRAFWITIGREFHSIDRLRLDKYMYLIRCYVGVAFEVFMKGKQQQDDAEIGGKKRKREEEEAAASKGKNGKKQNKRSKGKKADEKAEEAKRVNEATPTDGGDDDDTQNNNGTVTEKDSKWAGLDSYLTILEEGPLCPLNFDPDQPTAVDEEKDYVPMPHGPDGLRYHIMDLWLDELEKVIEFEDEEENEEQQQKEDANGGDAEDDEEAAELKPRKVKGDVPMDRLLRPIEKLRTNGPHKPVRIKAAEALDDERLVAWGFKERKVEEPEEEDSDEEWGGFGDV